MQHLYILFSLLSHACLFNDCFSFENGGRREMFCLNLGNPDCSIQTNFSRVDCFIQTKFSRVECGRIVWLFKYIFSLFWYILDIIQKRNRSGFCKTVLLLMIGIQRSRESLTLYVQLIKYKSLRFYHPNYFWPHSTTFSMHSNLVLHGYFPRRVLL